MDIKFTEKKLIEIFIDIDDLLKMYQAYQNRTLLGTKKLPTRMPELSASEVCTIVACYHLSGYKCFEYYYRKVIKGTHFSYFPSAPSYERFLVLMSRSYNLMWLWSLHCCLHSQRNGLYFIDSKKLAVCHLKREHSHKVFAGAARKGKTSTGWFFGFKLHLVINAYGQIVNWTITSGNVSDNNADLLKKLLRNLEGICVGDKGYYSSLFEWFYSNGLHLVLKPKKNINQRLPSLYDHQQYLKKRALIESVNDILTSICDVEHTRHRKPENAFANIAGAIVAYHFIDPKPCIFIKNSKYEYRMAA
jgi:hypothetical protein